MKTILSIALTLGLVSGASAEMPTKAERAFIIDYFTQTMRDPYSIKSPGISEVRQLTGARGTIPAGICVRYNAKDGYGAYRGIDTLTFVRTERGLAYGDHRQNVSTATCRDDAVTYAPFPELGSIR